MTNSEQKPKNRSQLTHKRSLTVDDGPFVCSRSINLHKRKMRPSTVRASSKFERTFADGPNSQVNMHSLCLVSTRKNDCQRREKNLHNEVIIESYVDTFANLNFMQKAKQPTMKKETNGIADALINS